MLPSMTARNMLRAIGPLLRTLVDDTPGINKAIVHTGKGWPLTAWPAHSFLSTAKTSFATPGLLRRTEEFDRKIGIRGRDCVVIELTGKTLLVVPVGETCLTIDASTSSDLRPVYTGLARVIDDIAQVLTAVDGE